MKSEVNSIILAFTTIFSLTTRMKNLEARNLDGSLFKMYSIVLVVFFVPNSPTRVQFFKETFLLAETSIKIVLGMLFLFLSNIYVKFDARKLT